MSLPSEIRDIYVVLHSFSIYTSRQQALLRDLTLRDTCYVAVVGIDCAAWEYAIKTLYAEAMSGLRVVPIEGCMTSAHPGQTLGEVVQYVETCCEVKGWSVDSVRVVTV